jgi:hypothetical protein
VELTAIASPSSVANAARSPAAARVIPGLPIITHGSQSGVGVTGAPVENRAREALGAERDGPFRKRQRLEVLRVVQRVEAQCSPRSTQVVAGMAPSGVLWRKGK